MKNYLKLWFDPSLLFPYWIATYILAIFFILMMVLQVDKVGAGASFNPSVFFTCFAAIVVLIFVIYTFYFYLIKLTVEGIEFEGERLTTSYSLGGFLSILGVGILLSIVTLGIYLPWLVRNIYRFFINRSAYKGVNFRFDADGITLFGILTLFIVLSMCISFSLIAIYGVNASQHSIYSNIFSILVAPVLYTLLFKWMIDGGHNGYKIELNVKMLNMMGYFFLQLLLVLVTLGIYLPLFYLRMYRYVIRHVNCFNAEGGRVEFDYDEETQSDFLFMWGQLLLTIVTIGIYYPWAYAKVTSRVLGKTSLTSIPA